MTSLLLDVHGLRMRVTGSDEVVTAVSRDFSWFRRPDAGHAPEVEIEAVAGEHGGDDLPSGTASFVTPRNVVYHAGSRTIVDYFGRALAVHDAAGVPERLVATGMDPGLLHEAVYQFCLFRIGRHLDRIGLPRMHALGLSGPGGAVAVLLPSGGGKSTLAVRALRAAPGVRLISEDTPLVDRHGRLHPFPLRIGVNPTDAETLPAGGVRHVERMEFHAKLLLDVDAFADRIETVPRPLAHLVVGRRSLRDRPQLRRLPRRAAAGTLLREAVIGVGVYQGMEFLLQRGPVDALRLAPVAVTRARCCAAALRRAQAWELVLSRDHDANWAALEPLVTG